ncbi:TPA_asm: hypothetical protein GJJ62_15100 [Listeria monocytogenes]|uniref:hypothetical protein n=1 Tax=Listeria monocytogenes TaxID=1639 RepID=UPI0001B43FBF|nr:hypothetical protein [Listeria monocytogenes]AGR27322.1 hypothetical protein M641_01740 [Listeria monocytogenes]EAA0218241.1 hypothetical protein [Listeria monocytogenes]EAC2792999.1 hypothetical protein [Listeria monocytogenes]EAC2840930.1 hypothetical protein [Listeria monocytogenes]EAC8173272.1 hypothetical protein [Listeria monocytogenes]
MKIKINEDYVIRSNQYQYVLSKPKGTDKNGMEQYNDIGYFPTIEKALEAFAENHIRTSEISGFKELAHEVKMVRELLAGIKSRLEVLK